MYTLIFNLLQLLHQHQACGNADLKKCSHLCSTCVSSHYHPLPPITTFTVSKRSPWWQCIPGVLKEATTPFPVTHTPFLHSSIMSSTLNGAQHIACDPSQWAVGSSRGATLLSSWGAQLGEPVHIGYVLWRSGCIKTLEISSIYSDTPFLSASLPQFA